MELLNRCFTKEAFPSLSLVDLVAVYPQLLTSVMLHLHPPPIFFITVEVREVELLSDLSTADEGPHHLRQQKRLVGRCSQKLLELLYVIREVFKEVLSNLTEFVIPLRNLEHPCKLELEC